MKGRPPGESEVRVHFSRMLWLLLFGYLHFYFIWYGDILTAYATLGLIAWLFRDKPERSLIKWAAILIGVQFLLFAFFAMSFAQASAAASAPGATPEAIKQWAGMSEASPSQARRSSPHCRSIAATGSRGAHN